MIISATACQVLLFKESAISLLGQIGKVVWMREEFLLFKAV